MPFKSKAQQRLFFAKEERGELSKGTAMEWAHATPDIKKLPEHVSKKSSLMDKLAVATTLRGRLVLVTKLAAVKAARSGKLQAARKMAKYAQALEQGCSISKSASAAGMSFKEGAVIYSVMMGRIKQATIPMGAMGRLGGMANQASAAVEPAMGVARAGAGAIGSQMSQLGQRMQQTGSRMPGSGPPIVAAPRQMMQGAGRALQGAGQAIGGMKSGGIKQAEPGVMSPKGPSAGAGLGGAGAKMQQAGQAGMQMAASKGPGLQSALMIPAATAMQGMGRMLQGFGGRPGTASSSVPGAPGEMKRGEVMPQGLPQAINVNMPPHGGVPWGLLAAMGLVGGGGALLNAARQPKRPGRAAVEGAGAGAGAVGGGYLGAGLGTVLGGLGGAAAGGLGGAGIGGFMNGQQGAADGAAAGGLGGLLGGAALGLGAGGVGGAVGGGYLGHLMGRGVNNLTGGAPEDQQEEMAADSL